MFILLCMVGVINATVASWVIATAETPAACALVGANIFMAVLCLGMTLKGH